MDNPSVSRGATVYVRGRAAGLTQTRPIRKGTVKEATAAGLFVKLVGRNGPIEQLAHWSELSLYPNGPFGKEALVKALQKQKEKSKAETAEEAQKREERIKQLRKPQTVEAKPINSIAAMVRELVGYDVTLDEENGAYIQVTPAMAERWLDRSKGKNIRPLSQAKVDKYEHLMKRGLWSARTSEAVSFQDGFMLNGQHRMWAVCMCGLTIKMRVLFGVTDQELKYATDQGHNRATYVSLGVTREMVFVANCIRKNSGLAVSSKSVSNDVVERYIEAYREEFAWWDSIPGTALGKKKVKASDLQAVVMRAKRCGENAEKLQAFTQRVRLDPITGSFVPSANQQAITDKLNQFLANTKANSEAGRQERKSKIEWALKRYLADAPFSGKLISNSVLIWPPPNNLE